ncbi:MAG TPA: hypothetical protein VFJ06_14345 [Halococcus sp.]|nr:hypothetical protein [Halococcus sp.]
MSEMDIDESEFEDLPRTDIEVFLHVHFGMTGSFPLRLAELFFASDGLHIAEYGYITPLFGLGTKKHRRESSGMQAIYDYHGLDEVLLQADSVTWLAYDAIERIVLHDGGRFGRPKLTVYADEHSDAYRLHDEEHPEELAADIETCADRYDFSFETASGVGFSPRENIHRFFS